VQEVKAKEYVPRPQMLGLGAKPSEILQRPPKKHIRQVRYLSWAIHSLDLHVKLRAFVAR